MTSVELQYETRVRKTNGLIMHGAVQQVHAASEEEGSDTERRLPFLGRRAEH